MNAAFNRGEAITRLEHYADVIVLHLTLVTVFPKATSVSHWKKELKAFKGILKRYNNPKSQRKHNFKTEDIIDALRDVINSPEGKDYIANDIMGHKKGLAVDSQSIDWGLVEKAIHHFAAEVMG